MNDEIRFQLIPVLTENITMSTGVKFPPYNTSWHAVELNYTKGELSVLVDYRNKQSKLFSMTFELGDKVTIGSGRGNAGIFLSLSLSFLFFLENKTLHNQNTRRQHVAFCIRFGRMHA